MSKYRWFRRFIGGTWYRYDMTGQLPSCYGHWWTKKYLIPHRYYQKTDTEFHKEW